MKILLKGALLLDPSKKKPEKLDLLIEHGRIALCAPNIQTEDAEIIDLTGTIITPGLIDIHVHLREPGREDKETIETGSKAALAGGFTSIACMPNTSPVNDNLSVTNFIIDQARKAAQARVFPIGAISKGQLGQEMSEIGEMVSGGIVAISDDGHPVMNSELMRRALEYSRMFDLPIMEHAEDKNLVGKGVMNEGLASTMCGLPPQPGIAEDILVDRDIRLAEYTSAHIHICHLSRKKSLEIVRRAKQQGIHVTCEVTPHHLTLTDDLVTSFDTNYKMAPPLRTPEDIEALIQGLNDGTIDAIASDHAPHTSQEKELEFIDAPFGIIGLETTLPIVLTKLVWTNRLTLETLIQRLTTGPARVLHHEPPTLAEGAIADLTVIDPDYEFTIDADTFFSKSRNTPFNGEKVKGCCVMTLVDGEIRYRHSHWSKTRT
ncbi:dihydroorotase [bacterium]|nr:dihydroorotase [bacterium]